MACLEDVSLQAEIYQLAATYLSSCLKKRIAALPADSRCQNCCETQCAYFGNLVCVSLEPLRSLSAVDMFMMQSILHRTVQMTMIMTMTENENFTNQPIATISPEKITIR